MKHILPIVFVLNVCITQAQQLTLKIDQTVDYVIQNSRKGNDTITIGYSESGRYLWTNSKSLAKDLGRSIFRKNPDLLKDAKLIRTTYDVFRIW